MAYGDYTARDYLRDLQLRTKHTQQLRKGVGKTVGTLSAAGGIAPKAISESTGISPSTAALLGLTGTAATIAAVYMLTKHKKKRENR